MMYNFSGETFLTLQNDISSIFLMLKFHQRLHDREYNRIQNKLKRLKPNWYNQTVLTLKDMEQNSFA
jgi:hypothetical protein